MFDVALFFAGAGLFEIGIAGQREASVPSRPTIYRI